MGREAKNFDELKRWVGKVPSPGDALDMSQLVFDGCHLMSHRTPADVEDMLDGICVLMEQCGADEQGWELPPPSYNWKLRGTFLWRLVDKNYAVLSKIVAAERWEFIAAVALWHIRSAVQALRKEPVGIMLRRAAGERAQQAFATANWWLGLARAESRWKDVHARSGLSNGGKSGSASKYRKEEVAARHRQIRQEADQLRAANSGIKNNSIALILERRHEEEPGWGRRAINYVLKKEPS